MAKPKGWAKVDSKLFELGLGQSHILCFIGLQLHRNAKTNEAFPSRATLARYAGVRSTRQVTRLTDDLERCGTISKVERKNGSRNCSNIYRFHDPKHWRHLYGRDTDVSTSSDTHVSTPQDTHVSTSRDTDVSTSETGHLQKVVGNVSVTRGEQEQDEPLAQNGPKNGTGKGHRKPASPPVPPPCKRKMADAGGDALKTTKASLSSNGHCNGSRNGNRKPTTDIEGEATAAARNTARSKVSSRDEDDREPALSAFTRKTNALCDLLLEDAS